MENVIKELPKNQFSNTIRMIRRGDSGQAMVMRTATWNTLNVLGVKRDVSKAMKSTPKGSDQVDMMSIIRWMGKITIQDKKAIRQLVQIDATAVAASR